MNIHCPTCNSKDCKVLARISDTEYYTSDKTYKYKICKKCKTVFIEKFLTDKLDKIYPKEYYSNYQNKSFLYKIKKIYEAFYFKKKFKLKKGSKYSILDIGGGTGEIADSFQLIQKVKQEITILDISDSQKKICLAKGFNFIKKDFLKISNTKKKYDIILMVNFIEHIANPKDILKKASLLLKKNGRIFIKTPNTDNLNFEIFKKSFWGGYHAPRHWILFNKKNFKLLLKQTDFTIDSFQYTQGGPQLAVTIYNILQKFFNFKKSIKYSKLFRLLFLVCILIDLPRSIFFKTDQMILVLKGKNKKKLKLL